MNKDIKIDYSLVRDCRSWNETRCPHRSSIEYLMTTIYDKNTAVLKDTLIKDLKSICNNCLSYEPYNGIRAKIKS